MSGRSWRDHLPNARLARQLLVVPVLKFLVFLVVLLAVWRLIAGPLLVRYFEKRLVAACPPGEKPLTELLASYPPASANPSAKRLQELAIPLQIDLRPRTADDRANPSLSFPMTLKTEISGYFEKRQARADDGRLPVPDVAIRFLAERRSHINVVVGHLRTAPLPVWDTAEDRSFDAPIPNELGILYLARVLVLEAYVAESEGRLDDSRRTLEAANQLRASLSARAELISHLIALVIDGHVQMALRATRGLPGDAPALAASYDTRAAHRTAVRREAAGWWSTRGTNLLQMGPVTRWYMDPYLAIGFLDGAAYLERIAAEVDRMPTCAVTAESLDGIWNRRPASWNIVGKAAWPSLASASHRLLRRTLDHELTALVLRARRDPDVAGEIPSTVCPGQAWVVTREVGRLAEIHLRRRLDEPPATVSLLPLRFVSREAR